MPDDFSPPGHLGFAPSFVVLLGVLGIGWGAFIVSLIARAIRLRRLQEHENAFMQERARWQLLPGPSRVVHGRVEIDGDPVAIEIDVDQTVKNCTSKSSRWHEWKETSRRVAARAFRLVREDGQSVLVQPANDVLVVDALTTSYPDDRPMARVRSAVVRAQEEVYVYGDLVGGAGGDAYRGGSAFVVQSPRRGRMLVATEAMRDRYRARIRHSWRTGIGHAIVFLIFHGAFTTPFLAAMVAGTREEAALTNPRTYVTRGKHGPIHHWELTARAADGFPVTGEVDRDTYVSVTRDWPTSATSIPILRVDHSGWASYLGSEPTIHFAVLLFGFVGALVMVAATIGGYERSAPWYDRKRVGEHGGTGHWVETRRLGGGGSPIDPSRN